MAESRVALPADRELGVADSEQVGTVGGADVLVTETATEAVLPTCPITSLPTTEYTVVTVGDTLPVDCVDEKPVFVQA